MDNKRLSPKLPSSQELASLLHKVIDVLLNEDESYRPSFNGEIGSFLEFQDEIPLIILPDLHARYHFLQALLDYKMDNKTVSDLLFEKKIRIVFVGDGLHSELMTKERWLKANDEFLKGNYVNPFIKAEMAEGLSLMKKIFTLKIDHPFYVHFLKGNHENILNEESHGNQFFGKYALEGEIVKAFMLSYYGNEISELYANFEYLLPLFVSGKGYVISHAEPKKAYTKKQLIRAKKDAKIVNDLTWTANDEASGEAVLKLLNEFQKDYPQARYFVGHRYVNGRAAYRAGGKLVQFHNPFYWQFVYLEHGDIFDEEKNILRIEKDEDLWQQ